MSEKEELTTKTAAEEPQEASEQKDLEPKTQEKKRSRSKKAAEKPLSNRKRKMQDARFQKNPKGRYVSIKKRENGKKNVQARAIKLGRKMLGFQGRMILLGKGEEGIALVDMCKQIREALKSGKTDEEAEALLSLVAVEMCKKFKDCKKCEEEVKEAVKEEIKPEGA